MGHFISAFRVRLLLWMLIAASTNSHKIKGRLPDLGIVSSFLEQFIKPYIEHIHVSNGLPRASHQETKTEKVIRLKVAELKHLLQDNEVFKPKFETDDNLTLQGNDETTIIEFVPKISTKKNKDKLALREHHSDNDTFKKNIDKYKQLRKKIVKVLDKEKTASSTKKLITRTLDEMLATLIENQCTWKGADPMDLKHKLLKSDTIIRRSMEKLQTLTNKEWVSLRKQYLNFLKFKDIDKQREEFMKQFHDFFTSIMNDTTNLAYRYKIRCQLIQLNDHSSQRPYLREDKMVEKNQCDNFKVCSNELRDFLSNFYRYLNDTAVSTFRNYAAMYIRDVNADIGQDKDIVVSVLENLGNTAERKVSKVFKKDLDKLTLDENKKKGANIQHISEYVTNTVDHAKKVLKKNLDYELGAMKTKLFLTVKDDLNVNLKADMDNLGKLFVDRICALFVICNGKYASRRHDEPWTFTPKATDNVYVKVQLTFDDELKESIARAGSIQKLWQGKDMTHRYVKSFGIDEKKFSNVNVTRTTISTSASTHNITSHTNSTVTKTTSTIKEITTNGGVTVMAKKNI